MVICLQAKTSEYHAEVDCDDWEMSYRFSAHLHLGHIRV